MVAHSNVCDVCVDRLSDFLFVAARFVALKDGRPEIVYRKHKMEVRVPEPSA